MSIKTAIKGVVFCGALISLFAFAGCANENQPYYTVPVIELKGGNCLKGATATVDRYLKGEAKVSEVDSFWECADYAVRTFQEKVEGSDPRGYSATELRDFLERYFLGGSDKDAVKIADDLLSELMGLKRLLVGGSATFISREELERGIALIAEFRTISIRLLPHVQLVFHQNDGVTPSDAAVDQAAMEIVEVFAHLGEIIERNKVGYSFAQMERLLRKLNELFQKHQKSDTFDTISKILPLMARAKALLLNSDTDQIGGDEWRATCDIVGRGFALYLRGFFFLNEKSLFDASRLAQFKKMADMAMGLFVDAFGRRQNEPIRLDETDGLIDAFAAIRDMPFGLSTEQFKSMWRTLVDKVLADAAKNSSGLSLDEVKKAEAEFSDWLTIQAWLLGESGEPKGDTIDEMKMVLNSPWPLNMDVEGRLVISPDDSVPWNVESMSRMNWLRAVFRLVLLAYTKDESRRANLVGLDKSEFEAAFADLKPFLVAMGLIEESNTTFGDRLMRDANLFTTRGNGDKYLNFVELIEYVHYILSGIDAGKLFVERVKADCPLVQDALDAACFRVGFRKYFAERYDHLPLMVSYATTLNDKGWANLLKALEKTTRDEGNANTPVATSAIYEMGILLQYIETVMIRYDADLNGKIDLKEGLTALPLFENILAEFAGLDPKKDAKEIRSIFTYMLKYGEPPNPKNLVSLVRYLFWRWNEKNWKVNADRGVILQILSALSSL